MPIQLTLKNAADGSATLTAGRKNTLALMLVNADARDVPLKGGVPVTADLAPGGPSSLFLNFGDLVDAAVLADLAITPAPGWTSAYFAWPAPAWVLTANRDAALVPGAALKFTIDNVVPRRPRHGGRLVVDYYNFAGAGGTSSVPLDTVSRAAAKPLPIEFALADADERVLVGPAAGSLSLVMANASWHEPLVSPDGAIGASPRFVLRWIAGQAPGYGALTTEQHGSGMTLAVEGQSQKNLWKIDKNNEASQPFWTLTPLTREVLGIGEDATLQLRLSNIVTHLQPGMTRLYLGWKDVPGYEDGGVSLRIHKSPRVKIVRFGAGRTVLDFESGVPTVSFSWKVEHAIRVQLGSRIVATASTAQTLEGTTEMPLAAPFEVALLAGGEGRGNVTASAPIAFSSIGQYLVGKTCRGTRKDSKSAGRDRGDGGPRDLDTADYDLIEQILFTSSSAATYTCQTKGTLTSRRLSLRPPSRGERWRMETTSTEFNDRDEWTGEWRALGSVVRLTTAKDVLEYDVTTSATGAPVLTLRTPLNVVRSPLLGAQHVDAGAMAAS